MTSSSAKIIKKNGPMAESQEENVPGAGGQGGDPKAKRKKRVLASYNDVSRALDAMPKDVTQNLTSSDLTRALKHLGITMSHGDFDMTLRDRAGDKQAAHRSGKPVALPSISMNKVHSTVDVLSSFGAKQPNTVSRKLLSRAPAVGMTLRTKLEEGMKKNWKRLQKDFRTLDADRTGLLDMPRFLRALSQCGLALTGEEVDLIYVQHGHGDTANLWYMDFLKNHLSSVSFQSVVNDHETAKGAPATGRASAPPQVMIRQSVPTPGGEAGERVRFLREIAQCWRGIRQACVLVDTDRSKGLRRDQVKAVLLRLGHTAKNSLLDELLGLFTTPEGLVDYNTLLKYACQQHLPTLS